MATVYLRSTDGNDGDDGSTWALAKATLAAALTAAGAGGTVYMSQAHAESAASAKTFASPGTAASPTNVICVNDGAAPPTALATTGAVTTTGASAMTWTGFAYYYGVTFNCGSTGGGITLAIRSVSPWFHRFESCKINLVSASSSSGIAFGSLSTSTDDQGLELLNTTITFGNVAQNILNKMPFKMIGGSIAATGSVPTTLFGSGAAGNIGTAVLKGVDLSAFGSGKTLITASVPNYAYYYLENCKLGASVAITTGTVPGQGGAEIEMVNCDSGDTIYRYYKESYQGIITQDTDITRVGGANDGATGFSRKLVSNANSEFFSPLKSNYIVIDNDVIGSAIIITMEIINSGSTLTDAQVWLEVEYMGTSGVPLQSYASDAPATILTAGANQTSSSESWNGGLGSAVTQKLAVTVTPREVGPIKVRVALAKPSQTIYACPKVTVS